MVVTAEHHFVFQEVREGLERGYYCERCHAQMNKAPAICRPEETLLFVADAAPGG